MEGTFEVEGSCLKGPEFEGVRYEQLLPWVRPMGDAFRVIVGDYVTTTDGTGIVHIAPTFGADDNRVAKQAGIAPLFVIDRAGKEQPMVDRTGKFFHRGARSGLRGAVCRRREIRRVCGPLREERLRRYARARCADARRGHRRGAQRGGHGFQDREARPLLSALLAHGQTGALLSARLVVHPDHERCASDDRTQPHDPLDARIDRYGPLSASGSKGWWTGICRVRVSGARRCRCGPPRITRAEMHWFDGGADGRDRARGRGRRDEGESLQGVPCGRHVEGELCQDRPAPSLCGPDRARLVQGRADAPRERPDRRVVRFGRHALCAAALSVRASGGFRRGLSRRLHRRGRRPDARLVLSRCMRSLRCCSIR